MGVCSIMHCVTRLPAPLPAPLPSPPLLACPQVTAVGMRTEWGRVLASITEEDDEMTPRQVGGEGEGGGGGGLRGLGVH